MIYAELTYRILESSGMTDIGQLRRSRLAARLAAGVANAGKLGARHFHESFSDVVAFQSNALLVGEPKPNVAARTGRWVSLVPET